MERAIKAWMIEGTDPPTGFVDQGKMLKLSYTIYGILLLLPPSAFESTAWQAVLQNESSNRVQRLYELVAIHMKVTHIAITKPIPSVQANGHDRNVLRSPSNFQSLYGDFGPSVADSVPTQQDLDKAFWVIVKQNGIFQTYAPRWTMFSRGNIAEKARLITLPSVINAVEQGVMSGKGSTAVDLYAGIGYFAFSYLKAGVSKCLGWELNPWSVEGLEKGARANGWKANRIEKGSKIEEMAGRMTIFSESNEFAAARIAEMRADLPPVRHVNCGLLPTSRDSWETAVDILDPGTGGWVHVHENFGVREIEHKAKEVQLAFKAILAEKTAFGERVELANISRLKSYAPGVVHCVLDIYIPPCDSGL